MTDPDKALADEHDTHKKEGRITFTDGSTGEYDYVNISDGYVFVRGDYDDRREHKYIPWHQIEQVTRIFED